MLKIFTSYTPGAGKSYLMVHHAVAEKQKGRNVVIGFLNGKHRDMEQILKDNNIEEYSQRCLRLENIISKSADVVILDEMGMKIKNKGFVYENIEKLLYLGIDVYTSANLKRFKGANPLFKEITGIGIKHTIPDRFLKMADEIYFVDREPYKMIEDYKSGKLFHEKYMNTKIMQKNFKLETLEKYRDLSLNYLKKFDNVIIEKRD